MCHQGSAARARSFSLTWSTGDGASLRERADLLKADTLSATTGAPPPPRRRLGRAGRWRNKTGKGRSRKEKGGGGRARVTRMRWLAPGEQRRGMASASLARPVCSPAAPLPGAEAPRVPVQEGCVAAGPRRRRRRGRRHPGRRRRRRRPRSHLPRRGSRAEAWSRRRRRPRSRRADGSGGALGQEPAQPAGKRSRDVLIKAGCHVPFSQQKKIPFLQRKALRRCLASRVAASGQSTRQGPRTNS